MNLLLSHIQKTHDKLLHRSNDDSVVVVVVVISSFDNRIKKFCHFLFHVKKLETSLSNSRRKKKQSLSINPVPGRTINQWRAVMSTCDVTKLVNSQLVPRSTEPATFITLRRNYVWCFEKAIYSGTTVRLFVWSAEGRAFGAELLARACAHARAAASTARQNEARTIPHAEWGPVSAAAYETADLV